MRTGEDDLTAKARIRDAAVLRFAADGFGASVRAIAADAGVSPALVIHHFGSKQTLRQACDEHVLATTREMKHDTIDEVSSGRSILHRFAEVDEAAPLLAYILRSLQHGGPLAKAFVDQMVADAVEYTTAGVRAGLIRPIRDEEARARFLILSSLGALLLQVTLDPPQDPHDVSALTRDFLATGYAPMIELYTEGLFTTRRMLDDYLQYVSDPPAET